MNFTGKKVKLRAYDTKDFDGYFRMMNDPQIQETNGLFYPVPREMAVEFFQEDMKRLGDNDYLFAIESFEGKCLGSISLLKIKHAERRGDTGVTIWDTSDWGKGYATDALKILLQFTFEELNLHRLRLHNGVYEFNKPAIRVYEKCGFVKEGIRRKEFFHRGRWWDVIDMAMLEDEYFKGKP